MFGVHVGYYFIFVASPTALSASHEILSLLNRSMRFDPLEIFSILWIPKWENKQQQQQRNSSEKKEDVKRKEQSIYDGEESKKKGLRKKNLFILNSKTYLKFLQTKWMNEKAKKNKTIYQLNACEKSSMQ